MLTGEYGCGKTYLIEKELTEALADTHIIVRVSLFGLDSADALNRAVRQSWFRTNRITYHLLREKTVSQTLHHIPDYDAVIHAIINKEAWHTILSLKAVCAEAESLVSNAVTMISRNSILSTHQII
ncbi:MAG: hypothetical protein J5961_05300 [Mogibacterium sp.]|nr:hypothetical protein [Mogibacterium sp.]